MSKNVGRVCGLLASIVLLAIGVIGAVPVVPKWAWITLGILGLVFVIGEFALGRQVSNGDSAAAKKQSQNLDGHSIGFQASRDNRVTDVNATKLDKGKPQ